MERHALEKLLAGGDEAAALAVAALRSGATYSVGDAAHSSGRHAGVFRRRLRRMRMHGVEPIGLERAVRLLSEHERPVRVGLIDSADRTWHFLLFLTEDGLALVACAGRPRIVREAPLQESAGGAAPSK
ncbi:MULTISPECIES: hypothetical protein [Streptomyces]|uniref:Uncharacterized protein n=1 Tax=Streptomyces spororaveus TaxID=284039 RepID=A0ABQ3TFV1_9ACTN|nr:hypothetical protein [Streptomyces spororaveus]MCM9080792.1 hypothetical protein [Streptomyces spororaveus]GHI78855.1 hypothetical protein Sspor_44160 [Streptomyces spororaveus]